MGDADRTFRLLGRFQQGIGGADGRTVWSRASPERKGPLQPSSTSLPTIGQGNATASPSIDGRLSGHQQFPKP